MQPGLGAFLERLHRIVLYTSISVSHSGRHKKQCQETNAIFTARWLLKISFTWFCDILSGKTPRRKYFLIFGPKSHSFELMVCSSLWMQWLIPRSWCWSLESFRSKPADYPQQVTQSHSRYFMNQLLPQLHLVFIKYIPYLHSSALEYFLYVVLLHILKPPLDIF